MDGAASPLAQAGVYRRDVKASLARVWENVFDWEHLPSLHARDFAACTLIDRGGWGWRVRLVNQPSDETKAQLLEMRADKPANQYVVTTLEGPGAGTQIRTRLTPHAAQHTGVEVTFHVPEQRPERLAAIGARYVEAYRRLWAEDEVMMRVRERALAHARRTKRAAAKSRRLGAEADVRARLPLMVTFGGARFRIVDLDGVLIAHAATCPHWLGPLEEAPVIDGCITCPWHGYSFDLCTGESTDGRGYKLETPPRIVIDAGVVTLVASD